MDLVLTAIPIILMLLPIVSRVQDWAIFYRLVSPISQRIGIHVRALDSCLLSPSL